jgi:hypothetical protein
MMVFYKLLDSNAGNTGTVKWAANDRYAIEWDYSHKISYVTKNAVKPLKNRFQPKWQRLKMLFLSYSRLYEIGSFISSIRFMVQNAKFNHIVGRKK